MRKLWMSIGVIVLLLVSALPVSAAPEAQGGDGIHVGPYELDAGDRAVGDLVVFGGPSVLREGSEFDGDLTVLGTLTIEPEAMLEGQLVVFGTAEVAGTVDGDVFVTGQINLEETAYIGGDVVSTGAINQDPGAVVVGDLQPMSEGDWEIPMVPFFDRGVVSPSVTVERTTPRWVSFLWNIVRGAANVVLMGLLALVIASLWPMQLARVGRAIEEAPLPSFGVGLLTLILAGLVALLLTITICLSPLAFIGVIIVAVGVLLGWVALGMALGRRILGELSTRTSPTPVVAAVVGTVLITLILALSRLLGPIHAFLLFLLVPPAAGAVLLTRFGTRPYATRGSVTPPPTVPPRTPRTPAPRPVTVEPPPPPPPQREEPPPEEPESYDES